MNILRNSFSKEIYSIYYKISGKNIGYFIYFCDSKKNYFMKLDSRDIKILNLLQRDAKISVKRLAEEVSLSVTPVYERIKRLERTGVINAYRAIIDRQKVGLELVVFCQVSLQFHTKKHIDKFERFLEEMPEIQEAYHIAGNFDYLLKVVVRDSNEYHDFIINSLSRLDVIDTVQSNFVMYETKRDMGVHIK